MKTPFLILTLFSLVFFSCKKDAVPKSGTISTDDKDLLMPKGGYSFGVNYKRPARNTTLSITGTAISTSEVQISVSGSAAGPYNVYENNVYILTSDVSTFIIGGLKASTTYSFQVITSGNRQVKSNTIQVTTLTGTQSGTGGVLLLVFDGITINGTSWLFNNQYFSPASLTADQINFITDSVQRGYNKVAGNIIVTTDKGIYDSFGPYNRQMTIETDSWEWYGQAGGVSIVGSFSDGTESPNFVFTSLLYENPSYIVTASLHEDGHGFGLHHAVDSCGQSYGYDGNWMGAAYGKQGFFNYHLTADCGHQDQNAIIKSKL